LRLGWRPDGSSPAQGAWRSCHREDAATLRRGGLASWAREGVPLAKAPACSSTAMDRPLWWARLSFRPERIGSLSGELNGGLRPRFWVLGRPRRRLLAPERGGRPARNALRHSRVARLQEGLPQIQPKESTVSPQNYSGRTLKGWDGWQNYLRSPNPSGSGPPGLGEGRELETRPREGTGPFSTFVTSAARQLAVRNRPRPRSVLGGPGIGHGAAAPGSGRAGWTRARQRSPCLGRCGSQGGPRWGERRRAF
jgi:hypothetical protein